jgi:hypothetical protein
MHDPASWPYNWTKGTGYLREGRAKGTGCWRLSIGFVDAAKRGQVAWDLNSGFADDVKPSSATPKPNVIKASNLLGHRGHGAPTQRPQRDGTLVIRWIVLGAPAARRLTCARARDIGKSCTKNTILKDSITILKDSITDRLPRTRVRRGAQVAPGHRGRQVARGYAMGTGYQRITRLREGDRLPEVRGALRDRYPKRRLVQHGPAT